MTYRQFFIGAALDGTPSTPKDLDRDYTATAATLVSHASNIADATCKLLNVHPDSHLILSIDTISHE